MSNICSMPCIGYSSFPFIGEIPHYGKVNNINFDQSHYNALFVVLLIATNYFEYFLLGFNI